MLSAVTGDEENGLKTDGNFPLRIKTFNRTVVVDEVDFSKEDEDLRPAKSHFQMKQLIVAGMMDISLLTSNANQLKYILAHNLNSAATIVCIALISLSIFLQIGSGVGFIYKVSPILKFGFF